MAASGRFAIGVALLCHALLASAALSERRHDTPRHIDYEVERTVGTDAPRYVITLRFQGDHSGRTTLHVPSDWASAQQAEQGIEALTVLTPDARIEETGERGSKRIVHRPDAQLVVRYTLKQIGTEEPSATQSTQFLPVIQPGYFEWIGWTAWVVPAANNERVHIRLAFKGLPSDWAFASSFGLDPAAVVFDGDMNEFRSAVFLGGDFRLRSRPARGGPVVTAVRGDWSFRDSELADRVATIVDGERTFWRDESQRHYLVALLPMAAQPHSGFSTGTGLSRSFVTFVTNNLTLDDLNFLWTHEYFHNWNNPQLGQFPEPQALLYWFSEGFTDYYTSLLQLRWGMSTLEQYATAYDGVLKSLAEMPEGDLPNSEVAKRFFTDGNTVGRLPYWRGMLVAAQWDASIRAHSHGRQSLDDAMRLLRSQHADHDPMLDVRRIVEVMHAFGVSDPAADLAREIDRGEPTRLQDGVLTSCIAIGEVTEPRVDLGFDLAASTRGGPIAGVRVDGPAYAAGVRETQFLRSATGANRTDRLVEVGVQDAGQEEIRVLRYYPVGAPLTRQTATQKADLTDAQRGDCLRSLGVRTSTQVPSRFLATTPR